MNSPQQKDDRILSLYTRLQKGDVIRKREEAQRFGVTEKSIQRDIDTLRAFLESEHAGQTVVYDKRLSGYRMDTETGKLSNSEILAVCKILLESRSLPRADMNSLLDKLLACCVPENNKKQVSALIGNERLHYIEPHHGVSVLDRLWDIGAAVKEQRVMKIEYEKLKNHEVVTRTIEPVGIMFSEYYFYLTAFIRGIDKEKEFENADDLYPTIYRIDRIKRYKITDEHFQVRYAGRFEEGEFRKRVQFMFGGKLQTIRFRYTGSSIEAVLDRLPTAEAKENPDGYQTVLTGDESNLSQGQRQLLAIARAAVADPPVLILDEATSSIDTRTEGLVQAGMDALMKGRTTFVIAHRLSTIKNSDCIMVMEQGRIIERGSHDELIEAKGKYYQLYTGNFAA